MKILNIFLSIALLSLLYACDESSTIGNSIIQEEIEIVEDSSFTVTGKSVVNSKIQSRTVTQLLGKLDAKEYGSLKSDVVTQFMPAGAIDTVGVTVDDIDSVKMVLYIPLNGYVGDSITPMGLNVYRLNRQLPSPIYSDFNPADYYSEDDLLASKIYTVNALGESDSVAKLNYRQVYIDMPLSLGKELFSKYKEDPASYLVPSSFAQFFPGVYMKNTFGTGRVTRISGSEIKLYYHRTEQIPDTDRDTTYNEVGNYFAVTPEIITNNNIKLSLSDELTSKAENGENIIVAPAGMDVEIKFPTQDILNFYRENGGNLTVINSLSFEVPAEEITNEYNITPPPYLLLVLSNEKDNFFAKSKITDDKTSFYAAYDPVNKKYSFAGLRQYLIDMRDKGQLTDDDITFTLTPVSITTESYSSYYSSSAYINEIVPYVQAPAMVKLNLDKAKIKLVFSKQTINF